MVYSPEVTEGDYFAMSYVIQGGDVLSKIVKRFALQVDWRFIQRINNIAKPNRIRAGQRIKLINPEWPDPRTGRTYSADDPANPIGERWLGLQGLDEATRDLMGYGIHGTIAPETIGKQSSMGCIRMRAQDVEVIYEVLVESVSTVEIRND